MCAETLANLSTFTDLVEILVDNGAIKMLVDLCAGENKEAKVSGVGVEGKK